jgi:hypothetical protein
MSLRMLRIALDCDPELIGSGSPVALVQHSHPLLEVQLCRLAQWLLSRSVAGQKEGHTKNQARKQRGDMWPPKVRF